MSKIDEFFFEHHVTRSPMEFQGWEQTLKPNKHDTAQSGRQFQDLPVHVKRNDANFNLKYPSSAAHQAQAGPAQGAHNATHDATPAAGAGAARHVVADNDITASYEIFHTLREHGVRSHSWV